MPSDYRNNSYGATTENFELNAAFYPGQVFIYGVRPNR